MAQCCQPVPGDDICGYVTVAGGFSIHRSDCETLLHMELLEPQGMWQDSGGSRADNSYQVDMMIEASHRSGLFRDDSMIFANEKINVTAITPNTDFSEN